MIVALTIGVMCFLVGVSLLYGNHKYSQKWSKENQAIMVFKFGPPEEGTQYVYEGKATVDTIASILVWLGIIILIGTGVYKALELALM
jgi:hypothetical protein